tara:strand:+ start:1936 stop:3141 length:1206 start_codon:yes stop_codon:yes gene_type:complete
MSVLKDKNILLGVSGGIAAYKSITLLRLLKKSGAHVQVIFTKSAHDFVTSLTFSTLSERPVLTNFFEEEDDSKIWNNHVDLADWSDYYLIVPATSSTLSKMVSGNADNLLVATYLSCKSQVFFAPAMDLEMYKSISTKSNIEALEKKGDLLIKPGKGPLASGLSGEGRVEEPEKILEILTNHIKKKLIFCDKSFLVTAGPTYEMIDPVRFIGNFSSGKMGFEIAKQASSLGAKVHLISGPSNEIIDDENISLERIVSADEMYKACMKIFPSIDICIMSAAVSDFKPVKSFNNKIKKSSSKFNKIDLVKNKDILKDLSSIKKENQKIIGFALETKNELDNAKNKLKNKNLDAIVLNSLNDFGAGFNNNTNKISFITSNSIKDFDLKNKIYVAKDILLEIFNL